jgi:hypothetical protein
LLQAPARRRSLDTLGTEDFLSLLNRPKVLSRFRRKFGTQEPDECWLWIGAKWDNGYGKVYLPGPVPFGAHRASWIIANQTNQPSGFHVCHTCDVKLCVNPSHLYLGTPLENSRDAVTRNMTAHGSRQGSSKLTEDDIPHIRKLHADGETKAEIARRFNVSHAAVWQIVTGNYWRRVT